MPDPAHALDHGSGKIISTGAVRTDKQRRRSGESSPDYHRNITPVR
ncbi:hypothetical protein [Actinokineospora pegani]|nr:hypothetical protein [Actinokineospora pegani]